MTTVRRLALPGVCALFVGVGLGRFAYAPFIPALAAAHWTTVSGAGYLGAGNLAGYVAGAILAPFVRAPVPALRASMLTVVLGFLASAVDLGDAWLLFWRVLLGIAGGVAMGLAGPILLAAAPAERRGALSGYLYAGVGLGLILSGAILPPLLVLGLPAAWLGVGLLALAATAFGWHGWPADGPPLEGLRARHPPAAVVRVALAYALYGAAIVPHTLFLVDHIARGLGRGMNEGGVFWVLLGLGAVSGPLLAGPLADRIGFAKAVLAAYVALAAATVLPALSDARPTLALSALLVGACLPSIGGLVGGWLVDLVGPVMQRRWWPPLVVAFALGQAAAGYLFTWLADLTHDHRSGFALAAALAALGAGILAAKRPAIDASSLPP